MRLHAVRTAVRSGLVAAGTPIGRAHNLGAAERAVAIIGVEPVAAVAAAGNATAQERALRIAVVARRVVAVVLQMRLRGSSHRRLYEGWHTRRWQRIALVSRTQDGARLRGVVRAQV